MQSLGHPGGPRRERVCPEADVMSSAHYHKCSLAETEGTFLKSGHSLL